MYIEELVLRLACEGKYLFSPEIVKESPWEQRFLSSLGSHLDRGGAFTEKQAILSLRIVRKYKRDLEAFFNTSIDIDNPVYRLPFRTISEEKTISIEEVDGKKSISVRFPYDQDLIRLFHEYVNDAAWTSLRWGNPLKNEIASWNSEHRAWVFTLKEENIVWLQNNVVSRGFVPDSSFVEHVSTINTIVDNVFEYAPCIVKEDGKFKYKNVSNKVPEIVTDNVLEMLFKAKRLGITAWTDEIDAEYKALNPSPVTAAILNTSKPLFVSNESHTIEEFKDVVKYAGPVLMIVPGGSEVNHTMAWHKTFNSWGISDQEISIVFRMPNQSGGVFNQYIRDHHLNNEVNENTRIVFASTKIPKPLIKSGIKFGTVINLGYYRDLHFSMSVILNSTTNVCYYNDKQPYGVTDCLSQN